MTVEIAKPQQYIQRTIPKLNNRFKRWLVVIDVAPDIGTIPGMDFIPLGRRTLQVIEYKELSRAVKLVSSITENLEDIVKSGQTDDSMLTPLRFRFCIVDLLMRTALLQNEIDTEKLNSMGFVGPNLQSGVTAFKALKGLAKPRAVLLDNTDVIKIIGKFLPEFGPSEPVLEAPPVGEPIPPVAVNGPRLSASLGATYDALVDEQVDNFMKWLALGPIEQARRANIVISQFQRKAAFSRSRVIGLMYHELNDNSTIDEIKSKMLPYIYAIAEDNLQSFRSMYGSSF